MQPELFAQLLGPRGQKLLALAAADGPLDDAGALALGTRLRREHPPELVAAALTQARLRERAREKFGAAAARMYFTDTGLQQATRAVVAAHRARRYAGRAAVADLGCGIGGDLLALARQVDTVTGVDADALSAAIAAANIAALGLADRVQVNVAEATSVDLCGDPAVFCDPARRTGRGRVFDPAAYRPPWSFVASLLDGSAGVGEAGVKVAPGIDHGLVPDGVEAEWVSVRGQVVEAALYSGGLRTGVARRASLLPGGATLACTERVDGLPAPLGPVGRYLYEPDGAVIRAHLVAAVAAEVGGWLVDPTIAYVTADRLHPSPFVSAYEVREVMPFGLKRVRRALNARGVGRLTVKKRGSALDPESVRAAMRLRGDNAATLVLTRCAGAPTALIVDPVGD